MGLLVGTGLVGLDDGNLVGLLVGSGAVGAWFLCVNFEVGERSTLDQYII